jgi:hypothetical protein
MSARFASVVGKAGKPSVYLMLVAPEKDASLQKAIEAHRVMVLHQPASGTDYGTVGFEKSPKGQILVFPKSLKSFAGIRIVGVKYDLLEDSSKSRPQLLSREKKPQIKVSRKTRIKVPKVEPPPEKVLALTRPEPQASEDETSQRILDLEGGIRRAMEMLEQGRQVAAFNVLKRLAD